MLLKKILYHGGFATLGIALLIGMGVLQANGLKATEDGALDNDSAVSSPTDDASAPAVAMNATDTEPAAPAPAEAKPIQVARVPASVPAPKPVPAIKNSLDDATAFSVFDTAHKTSSKKNFKATTADLRHAKAYYDRLAQHHKHAVIKARVNGDWVSVSAKDFNSYLKRSDE